MVEGRAAALLNWMSHGACHLQEEEPEKPTASTIPFSTTPGPPSRWTLTQGIPGNSDGLRLINMTLTVCVGMVHDCICEVRHLRQLRLGRPLAYGGRVDWRYAVGGQDLLLLHPLEYYGRLGRPDSMLETDQARELAACTASTTASRGTGRSLARRSSCCKGSRSTAWDHDVL